MELAFTKMHGIGNDVVVIDARQQEMMLTAAEARLIADRHFGIGCDQIMVITPADDADIGLMIYNNDGSESGACGNGTHAVLPILSCRRMLPTGLRSARQAGGLLPGVKTG